MAEDCMRPHAVARQWPQNDHSGQIRPMATMSALLRKADIPQRRFNVSFGPIADIWLRELPPELISPSESSVDRSISSYGSPPSFRADAGAALSPNGRRSAEPS